MLSIILVAAAGFAAGFFAAYRFYYRRRVEHIASSGSREMAARNEAKDQLAQAASGRTLATLGSMAEGVLIVDAQGRAVLANNALLDALGLKKGAVEGAYFWEIFRDSEVNEMLENCLKHRRVAKKEHSVLLSDKTFEIQVSPIASGSDFLGAVGVFHDVTRLKELERARTEFVANVSHELKTPLTSILGYVETLKEGAVEDVENRMKFLDTVEEHAKNLSALVEDLLLLSSVESGKSALRLREVDFGSMADRVLKAYAPKIREKKITLSREISPEPFVIRVDEALFERAFSNLVDNAVKYTPPGGAITVTAARSGAESRLTVADTGIGIADHDLPRIFERFYRADKSRSRESGGTGIGLSIVKHIVERHGGRIEVESVPQKGAKFSVVLA